MQSLQKVKQKKRTNRKRKNINEETTKQDIKEPRKAEVIPNVEDPDEANKEQTLYKCPNCGRSFKREAYAKHVPICQRVFHSKGEQDKKAKEKEKEKEKDKKK